MYLQTITKTDQDYISKLEMIVQKETGWSVDSIRSKTRVTEVVIVRFIMAYLMKKYTIMSLKSIGSYLGGRDHSTIINSLHVVSTWFDQPKMYKAEINLLLKLEGETNA